MAGKARLLCSNLPAHMCTVPLDITCNRLSATPELPRMERPILLKSQTSSALNATGDGLSQNIALCPAHQAGTG